MKKFVYKNTEWLKEDTYGSDYLSLTLGYSDDIKLEELKKTHKGIKILEEKVTLFSEERGFYETTRYFTPIAVVEEKKYEPIDYFDIDYDCESSDNNQLLLEVVIMKESLSRKDYLKLNIEGFNTLEDLIEDSAKEIEKEIAETMEDSEGLVLELFSKYGDTHEVGFYSYEEIKNHIVSIRFVKEV